MEETIIKIENLKVIYNQGKSNEVRSLDDVSLKVFPQEYVIIHGPSGCGKSTLMYSIAGLQEPTSGSVVVAGKELTKMKKKDKLELHQDVIGMIFQAFYLIESLNIIDNVCLPMNFKGIRLSHRRAEAMKLLARFGIAEQAYKFPNQLSGGQKQRVAIARALINNPKIILADEPVGNLDSESSVNVMKIIKELNEIDKKTIILVTHNAEHLHYGDRIVSMRDGKIINEEVNKEKRPPEAVKMEKEILDSNISSELRVLMRAFKNLNPQQIGSLLVPYRSKQLLFHILFGYNEEQINAADGFLKELLFKNINIEGLKEGLDNDAEKGGAGWDKRRAESFSARVKEILWQADFIQNNQEEAYKMLSEYLMRLFNLELDVSMKELFSSLLGERIKNRIDCFGLQKKFDTPRILGGLGMNLNTAEKIVKEVDIIMLLSYSPS
jgi:putative ABC transport system ATP-binding protein